MVQFWAMEIGRAWLVGVMLLYAFYGMVGLWRGNGRITRKRDGKTWAIPNFFATFLIAFFWPITVPTMLVQSKRRRV